MNKCCIISCGRHHGPFHSLRASAANPKVKINEWQGSSVEADNGSLINACELMNSVQKYFTEPQVIHPWKIASHRFHALLWSFWSVFRSLPAWAYQSWGSIFSLMNGIPARTDVSGHSGHECLRWLTRANHAPNTPKYQKTQFTFLNRCFLCNVKVIIWKGKSPPLGLYDRKRYIMGLWKRSSLYPL